MAIPSFEATQTASHVFLVVRTEACDEQCKHRAVVDGGSTFGLACSHFHLPLVFPEATLVDGRLSSDDDGPADAIRLRRETDTLHVTLHKREAGKTVPGLEALKASVFPLLEDDEEGQQEERLFGLEMLQRGLQTMKSDVGLQGRAPSNQAEASSSRLPQPPNVPKTAKTKVHEYFSEESSEEETVGSSRVRLLAAYRAEDGRWDEGMYLDNFVDEEGEVKYFIEAKLKASPRSASKEDQMKLDLPLTSSQVEDVHLLLLELLLAHAYDYRTTLGEPTVESAWTISVLTRSLVAAYLPASRDGDTVSSVLEGSIRRQLSFPLYRSWDLSMQVARAVSETLRDRRSIFPILSSMERLLEEAEDEAMPIYAAEVLSPLICIASTLFTDTSLNSLADRLDEATRLMTKAQISDTWDIELLEDAAREALREGQGGYV